MARRLRTHLTACRVRHVRCVGLERLRWLNPTVPSPLAAAAAAAAATALLPVSLPAPAVTADAMGKQ